MPARCPEPLRFALVLAALVVGFFHESLLGQKVLSPADVLFVSASFREVKGPDYEPYNRLLMDPVLQFQPWLEFNRSEIHAGRLPLWNPYAGCGAPHLANGQSAVFDPFHAIAYLGRLPDAYGWMAALRLWVAGLGMFLLARHWGLRPWGRWFAGLVYPFSGFLVVWLLYPVTNVAIWFPWVMLASDRVLDAPTRGRISAMALVVGASLLGGHVQTSAHLLLAAGWNMLWRFRAVGGRARAGWLLGMVLGIGLAAVEWLPLAEYLTRSPVWTDRAAERKPPWTLVRPRVLDVVCNALPYAFGSQRRGHPNLARGLGVHNLNESSGGFVGLATLIWLAPLAWSIRRVPRVRWLFGLTAFGLFAGYRWPPVDNFLRALPVLNVTDNRRLSLWVAFGLSLLGGIGLDRLGAVRRGAGWKWWARVWLVGAACCSVVALGVGRFGPKIAAISQAHYEHAARETPGADFEVYRRRADRQTRDTLSFIPRYYGLAAAQLAGLAAWLFLARSRRLAGNTLRAGLLGLTMIDLFGFGFGLNPAIDRADDRPLTPLIEHLRRVAPPPWRVLGVGEELPPNVCMRYGLADIRNYDSIELAVALDQFATLYPDTRGERTSRRAVTWEGVIRARDLLQQAGVRAIVAATPPPVGAFSEVERIGSVWVAHLDPGPQITSIVLERKDDVFVEPGSGVVDRPSPGRLTYKITDDRHTRPNAVIQFSIQETSDGNWTVDGHETSYFEPGPTLVFDATSLGTRGRLLYRPMSFLIAGAISLACFAVIVFGFRGRFSP
jgi:hypothetical protein